MSSANHHRRRNSHRTSSSAGRQETLGMPLQPNLSHLTEGLGQMAHLRISEQQPVYPLGTREDVQQDDYQSPISSMFNRAEVRHDEAEARRRAQLSQPPEAPLNAMTQFASWSTNMEHMRSIQINEYRARVMRVLGEDAENPALPAMLATLTQDMRSNTGLTPTFMANPLFNQWQFPNHSNTTDGLDGTGGDSNATSAIDRQNRPPPLSSEELKVDIACKVCHEQRSDTLYEPCNHLVTCRWCADIWFQRFVDARRQDRSTKHRCVLCRKEVKQRRRVYLA